MPDAEFPAALDRARIHAQRWLDSLGDRPVGPRVTADQLHTVFGGSLPSDGLPAADVVDLG